MLREHPLEVAADRIERQRPRVALVRRGRLQERDHGRLGTLTPIFDRADKAGTCANCASLGQETGHLDIGIHPVLELAIELEEKPVLEKHRRVALLGVEHLGSRRFVVRLLRQQAAPHPDELPAAALQDGAARHQLEKLFAKIRIPERVVENRPLRRRLAR